MKGFHKGIAWEVRPSRAGMGGFAVFVEFKGRMDRIGWASSTRGGQRIAKERCDLYAAKAKGGE